MFEFKREIELNPKDYIHLGKYSRQAWKFKPLVVWGIALFITMFIAIIGITHTQKDVSLTVNILSFILLFVLSSALCWTIALVAKLTHKMFRNRQASQAYKKDTGGFKNGELLINERGVQTTYGSQRFSILWYQIIATGENEHAIYLYYTDSKAFILPRRYIGSLDELVELRAFIKAYTNRDLKYK